MLDLLCYQLNGWVKKMLTEFQKEKRLGRIGSSQIAAVLGLNPYKSEYAVWEEITGRSEFKGNLATNYGEILESAISQIFNLKYPQFELKAGETVFGPEPEWQIDTPDRLIFDAFFQQKLGALEIKAVGQWAGKNWNTETAPDPVDLQTRWHLLCNDVSTGWICGFLNIQDVRFFEIQRDLDYEKAIIEVARDWWCRHIKTDTPPPKTATFAEGTRYLLNCYPNRNGVSLVQADSPEALLLEELKEISEKRKALESAEETLKLQLAQSLGERAGIVTPSGDSFKLQSRKTVAWKQVALQSGIEESILNQNTTETKYFTCFFKNSVKNKNGD